MPRALLSSPFSSSAEIGTRRRDALVPETTSYNQMVFSLVRFCTLPATPDHSRYAPLSPVISSLFFFFSAQIRARRGDALVPADTTKWASFSVSIL